MRCLLYFLEDDADAARAYVKTLRDEGHQCQFRNADIWKNEPIVEAGDPPFDTILISHRCQYVEPVYTAYFQHPDCQVRGQTKIIKLPKNAETPVMAVVAEQEDLPPLPLAPVNYKSMPWFTLRAEVGKLMGTPPTNKKAALEYLKTLDLI